VFKQTVKIFHKNAMSKTVEFLLSPFKATWSTSNVPRREVIQ
jgi:hypothetical protein